MKIQGIAIIFILIILPISIIMGEYAYTQREIFRRESLYDSRLVTATDDALKAFQLNAFNDATSDIVDSKINSIEASANAFYNSIETNFGLEGYSKEELKSYVPALVYTMYDGYYIYSPYTNVAEIINDDDNSTVDGLNINLDSNNLGFGFKPYVYYSCRYKMGTDSDFIINYSLDNYITIQGIVKGKNVYKSGYLVTIASSKTDEGVYEDETEEGIKYYYSGIEITSESALTENLVESNSSTKSYKYIKINGTKYYWDETNEYIFHLRGGDRIKQATKGTQLYDDYVKRINKNINGVNYYRDAYEFTTWVNNNLADLETKDAVTDVQNSGNGKIFKNSKIEYPGSNFHLHRKEVIRYSIESNLSVAIANFNDYTNTSTNFQMPKLKETEWELLQNEISIISFLQGINIGGKIYNGYTVVTNSKTEEIVKEERIYITVDENDDNVGDYYHKINDKHLTEEFVNELAKDDILSGALDLDFEIRKDNLTGTYYTQKEELGCYTSIVGQENVDNTYESVYEYLKNISDSDPVIKKVKQKYYTALGRERWGAYKIENPSDMDKLLNNKPYDIHVSLAGKTTNSFTVNVKAKDKDGDNLIYKLYVDGKLEAESDPTIPGKTVSFTVSGLAVFSEHYYYVVASDTSFKTVTSPEEKVTTKSLPEDLTINLASRETYSFTISANAKDKDGDNLIYELYVDGKLKATSIATPAGITADITATGLSQYTQYSYYVIAKDGDNNRIKSDTYYVRTKAIPEGLTVNFDSKTINSFAIKAKATDKDGEKLTYKLYVNGILKATSAATNSGKTVSLTATGLAEYTQYEYYVTVTDQSSNTITSGKFNVRTKSKPEGLTVNLDSKTTNSFTIKTTATDKDGEKLTYRLYVNGNLKATSAATASGTTVSLTASGLSQYTEYQYYVTVTDTSLNTVTSETYSVITKSAPENLTVNLEGETKNSFTIKTSATDRDGEKLTYRLYVNGSLKATSAATAPGTEVSLQATGLSKYTQYEYYVTVTDESSNTAISETYAVRTKSVPEGLTVELDSKTINSFTIKAKASDKDGEKLTYKLYVNGTLKATSAPTTPGTKVSLSATGLAEYTQYEYYVTVTDESSNTVTSGKFNVRTKSIPEALTVSLDSKTTNSFIIKASATDKDGEKLTYRLYVNGNLKATSAATASGTKVSLQATGLSEYTQYEYYVTATDASLNTITSITYKVTTKSKPKNLTVNLDSSKTTTNSFTIKTSATDRDGEKLTYRLYVNGILKATSAATASGTEVSLTVSGLAQYTLYNYYVTVTDESSEKTTSSTYSVTTKSVPESLNVSFDSKTTNSFTVKASATDKDGEKLTYRLYVNGTLKATSSATASGTTVSLRATGLDEYTQYKYYVTATDQSNQVIRSSEKSVTTKSKPKNLTVNFDSKETNSFTIKATATDRDEDKLTYKLYVNGSLKATSAATSSGTTVTLTASGLSMYTSYTYYVIVTDTASETLTSSNYTVRTYCSGVTITCAEGKDIACTTCGGDAIVTTTQNCTTCGGDDKMKCTDIYCDGDGWYWDWDYCNECEGSKVKTCSQCDGNVVYVDGWFPCTQCGATGWYAGGTCDECVGETVVPNVKICRSCDDGYVECSWCSGTGIEWYKQPCGICKGDGEISCTNSKCKKRKSYNK